MPWRDELNGPEMQAFLGLIAGQGNKAFLGEEHC